MDVIIQSVLPLFAIIIVGYLARKFKSLGEGSAKFLNAFVMKFPLPILVFSEIANAPFSSIFNLPFIGAFLIGLFIPLLLTLWISRKTLQESLSKSVLRSLSVSFPNVGFMGIPIMGALFGKQGLLIAAVSVFLTVFQMIFTIVICEINNQEKISIKETIKSGSFLFIKHPMMVATILGIIFSATHLHMPIPLYNFTSWLGGTAGPTALFALGLLIVGQKFNVGKIEVTCLSIVKLFIHPLITLIFLIAFKTDPIWAAGGFILSALPTGVAISVFTNYYGTYNNRGTKTLLVTTVGSLVTLTLFIGLIPILWPNVTLFTK